MVIIGEISVPNEGVIYTSDEVKLKIDQTALDNGVLYITESAFCWKPDDREEGISIPWPKITLHAIQAQPVPSVYIMLDFALEWPGVYEGGRQRNGNGLNHNANNAEDDEDNDEGNESDEDPDMTLMWLQPKDPNTVEQIFNAMKFCQTLHPDPADSLSEDDDDFMEAEDDYGNEDENERYDDVGQGDMQNLQIEDEEKFADAEEE